MKKLLFIPFLFACFMGMGQTAASLNVIGKPIKIGNLKIAQHDFRDQMNWFDAQAACAKLGDGWRLPTKQELNRWYPELKKLLDGSKYWSSTESGTNYAWSQGFGNHVQFNDAKDVIASVRAVRAF